MDLKKESQRNNKMVDSCTDQKVNTQVDADLASAGVNRTWKGDGKIVDVAAVSKKKKNVGFA